jgi:hypothetical protein
MYIADANGEHICPGLLHELLCLLRIGHSGFLLRDRQAILGAADSPQLSLDNSVVGLCESDDIADKSDILTVR